jgi:hypothetical protein
MMKPETYSRITSLCIAVAILSALLFDRVPGIRPLLAIVGGVAAISALATYFAGFATRASSSRGARATIIERKEVGARDTLSDSFQVARRLRAALHDELSHRESALEWRATLTRRAELLTSGSLHETGKTVVSLPGLLEPGHTVELVLRIENGYLTVQGIRPGPRSSGTYDWLRGMTDDAPRVNPKVTAGQLRKLAGARH